MPQDDLRKQSEPAGIGVPLSEEEKLKIMTQFDKESNTRNYAGVPKHIAHWLCVALSVFMLLINTIWLLPTQVHRASFVALAVLFTFIFYPARKGDNTRKNYIPWYDVLLGVIGAAAFFYYVYNFRTIVGQMGLYKPHDFVIAVIGMTILFEACRRVVGFPLMIVVSAFMSYAYFGKYIPGDFGHAGYSIHRIITFLFYTTEGVIGTPIGVCATFIFTFLLFGAFLEKTGIGQFFIDVANSLAGWAVGGPAKVAVISSALQGTVSGSSVANTVGTGSFTIPMMKRLGYKPHFAAAVEATASTGGQIMPPIMGAAAFIMAEITGLPYARIIVAAVIPAILYFSSVFVQVHFEAKKIGLKGMPKDELPNFFKLAVQKGHLMLAIVSIVVFLSMGYSTTRSALYSILVAIVLSVIRKDTRMSVNDFFEALASGAKNSVSVGIACAMAGMIVGVVTMTGLGMTFATALVNLSALIDSEMLRTVAVLFFCAVACLLMGMGVPTTANYVIMATVAAPIVIRLGVPVLAAHMFVFYFGIIADITPPVALAAYAGSSIAKCDPMRTAFTATRLGIAAFIVPFIFALSPEILFIDPSLAAPAVRDLAAQKLYYSTYPSIMSMIQVSVTAFIGATSLAVALTGYISTKMGLLARLISIIAGLLLIYPGMLTDAIGISCFIFIFAENMLRARRKTATIG